nr:glycoside hydrolase family 97 N-terminal domain-containing protein [Prolixibacteraceae bacterium]
MKKIAQLPFRILLITSFVFTTIFYSCETNDILSSPDGEIIVTCDINKKQEAFYTVCKGNEQIVLPSKLGIQMRHSDFTKELTFKSSSRIKNITDEYNMLQGKQKHNKYIGNRQIFTFENLKGDEMQVIFQVSNDGVAFRYHFPEITKTKSKVLNEVTQFAFSFNTRAWMQPMSEAKTGWSRTNPSYEEDYFQNIPVGSISPLKHGWVFPALLKTNNTWVLLTETALDRNYCASRLKALPNAKYEIDFPESIEHFPEGNVNPETKLPLTTPWRVLTIGSLKTITESTLETDLANPQ